MQHELYENTEELDSLISDLENTLRVLQNIESIENSIQQNGIDEGTKTLLQHELTLVVPNWEQDDVEVTLEGLRSFAKGVKSRIVKIVENIILAFHVGVQLVSEHMDKTGSEYTKERDRIDYSVGDMVWDSPNKVFNMTGPSASDNTRITGAFKDLFDMEFVLYLPAQVRLKDLLKISSEDLETIDDTLTAYLERTTTFDCGKNKKVSSIYRELKMDGNLLMVNREVLEATVKDLNKTIRGFNKLELPLLDGNAAARALFLAILRRIVRVRTRTSIMYVRQLKLITRIMKNIDVEK